MSKQIPSLPLLVARIKETERRLDTLSGEIEKQKSGLSKSNDLNDIKDSVTQLQEDIGYMMDNLVENTVLVRALIQLLDSDGIVNENAVDAIADLNKITLQNALG